MRIETDDWLPVIDAGRQLGIDKATALRIARRLGIVETIWGVNVVRRADLDRMREDRRAPGNPQWIADGDAAAAAALRAVASRESRRRRPRT